MLLPISTRASPVIVPEIMTIAAVSALTALCKAASEETVTVEPPRPPEVPPFRVAYPVLAFSVGDARLTSGEAAESVSKPKRAEER